MRSGPRARAAEIRRFSDRASFVRSSVVRLDPDVAACFRTAEEVNDALRGMIALAGLAGRIAERRAAQARPAPEQAQDRVPEQVPEQEAPERRVDEPAVQEEQEEAEQ